MFLIGAINKGVAYNGEFYKNNPINLSHVVSIVKETTGTEPEVFTIDFEMVNQIIYTWYFETEESRDSCYDNILKAFVTNFK